MSNIKKILIGTAVFFLLFVAIVITLAGNSSRQKNVFFSRMGGGGVSAPSVGMPGGVPLGMPAPAPDVISSKEAIEPSFQAADSVGITGQSGIDKKVMKNGNLTMQVKNAEEASGRITQIAKDNGGDVFSSNFYEVKKGIRNGSISVKVPVNNFEKAYSEIKKVATVVVQESTSGQDVTEEYTDLQSQLKNKQAEEQQFVKILEQAEKIQDILDVTKQLSRVRGEIEMLQGRIKILDSQTDMANIFVSLTEDVTITVEETWRPWQVLKDSVNRLIKEGQIFISSLIFLVVTVIPIILIYLIILYVAYLIGRKIYKKIKKKKEITQ